MTKRRNLPTPLGAEAGAQLVRLSEPYVKWLEDDGVPDDRCSGCAFRLGTRANRSGATVLDALKCVFEKHDFDCHQAGRIGLPCHGALRETRNRARACGNCSVGFHAGTGMTTDGRIVSIHGRDWEIAATYSPGRFPQRRYCFTAIVAGDKSDPPLVLDGTGSSWRRAWRNLTEDIKNHLWLQDDLARKGLDIYGHKNIEREE